MSAPSLSWPKVCRCGASWSPASWATLTLVGYADGAEDGELELRNCRCGSTLAVKRAATLRN
ncbi:MAG TPA: hypothetical protein VLT33_09100 [Labilithrix sp.]|nr:hypothetical protein [Labilithrix sp.]